MIDEEYQGYNLTAVRRNGMWEVSIYPLIFNRHFWGDFNRH